MKVSKKKIIQVFVGIVIVVIMGLILVNLFADSYEEIFDQLAHTNIYIFVGMVILGNMYYVIDAVMYGYLFNKEGYNISLLRCFAVGYMCIFFNVTTFGAGIKPAQVAYLRRKGVNVGKGVSITTMPYVFHKTVICAYALVMLAFNGKFIMKYMPKAYAWSIYVGAIVNVLIIVSIILICGNEKFHNQICKLIDRIFKVEKKPEINAKLKRSINSLREGTKDIIKSPGAWIKFSIMNVIKMSCWYVIPIIAIFATGNELNGVTIAEAITVTSVMQLIMGVLPTSGGVGSLEVVYTLLFAAVFGSAIAGSSMILYRIATYYFPFIISFIIMIFVGRDAKMNKIDTKE